MPIGVKTKCCLLFFEGGGGNFLSQLYIGRACVRRVTVMMGGKNGMFARCLCVAAGTFACCFFPRKREKILDALCDMF